MRQEINSEHITDKDGNPAGGRSHGGGIEIKWQDGPLGRGDERQQPNGAFVEGVIEAALERLKFYQGSKFKCEENACAISSLENALIWLDHRTKDRESRGVEGMHKV